MAKTATKSITIHGERLEVTKGNKGRKIDLAKALEQRIRGMSLQEIADLHGVTNPAIAQALKPYKEHIDRLKVYSQNKANLQDIAASKVLDTIINKDLESEKASSLGALYSNLNQASRLERGESTSNVALKVVDLTEFALKNQDDDHNI